MTLSWRLKELPTIDEVSTMIEKGIITKDEARSIFFKDSDKPNPDELQEIKDELAIIRKLVTSNSAPTIIREIHNHEHYNRRPWYEPYHVLCSTLQAGDTNKSYAISGTSTGSILKSLASNAHIS